MVVGFTRDNQKTSINVQTSVLPKGKNYQKKKQQQKTKTKQNKIIPPSQTKKPYTHRQ
jgi:hypothetical protein